MQMRKRSNVSHVPDDDFDSKFILSCECQHPSNFCGDRNGQVIGNSQRRAHFRGLILECTLLDLEYFENLEEDQSHCRWIARGAS